MGIEEHAKEEGGTPGKYPSLTRAVSVPSAQTAFAGIECRTGFNNSPYIYCTTYCTISRAAVEREGHGSYGNDESYGNDGSCGNYGIGSRESQPS